MPVLCDDLKPNLLSEVDTYSAHLLVYSKTDSNILDTIIASAMGL